MHRDVLLMPLMRLRRFYAGPKEGACINNCVVICPPCIIACLAALRFYAVAAHISRPRQSIPIPAQSCGEASDLPFTTRMGSFCFIKPPHLRAFGGFGRGSRKDWIAADVFLFLGCSLFLFS